MNSIINNYDNNNKENKRQFNKIKKYYEKIGLIEKKYLIKFPKIEYDKITEIRKKIFTYKFVIINLYNDPEFFTDLKYLEIDYWRNKNEIECLETIWITEHYEYIEQIKYTTNDILILIEFGYNYNLISFIQYQIILRTLPKVNKIFELDQTLKNIYSSNINYKKNIELNEINIFFDIIDIILIKIDLIKKKYNQKNKTENKITYLLKKKKYANIIKKIKSKLEIISNSIESDI